MAKEETVVQEWLIDWIKLEDALDWKWVWKNWGNENLKETILIIGYDWSQTVIGECEVLQLFWVAW
jgi:hypothetical protein